MIKEAIKKLSDKKDLNPLEMTTTFEEIMGGSAEKSDMEKFLLSLKAKGESLDEIVAATQVMREKMKKVKTSVGDLIDTCGTGGAKINDINISTIVAIVLAGCGVKVAKHGNRSNTGKCGSSDILKAFNVNIDMTPEKVAELIEKIGIGFMHAPNFHPAMKNVIEVRKELKTRTIFNILGPLSNPAGATMQILGVFEPSLTEIMAKALNKLGGRRAYIVHGIVQGDPEENLDELSIKGKTKISELKDGKIETYYVEPKDFGMEEAESLDAIKGKEPDYNREIAESILKGKKGIARDMVLMNAAAALKMVGKAADFKKGVELAADCIDSRKALETLELLKKLSNQ